MRFCLVFGSLTTKSTYPTPSINDFSTIWKMHPCRCAWTKASPSHVFQLHQQMTLKTSKQTSKKTKKNLPRFSWVSLLDGYGQRSIGPKLFPCTFQDQVMEEKWCSSLAGRLSHHVWTYICIYKCTDIQINTYTYLHVYKYASIQVYI